MKNLKPLTIAVIISYIVLITAIYRLYSIDTNKVNKDILTEFISNESEYQYKEYSRDLDHITNSSLSISAMLQYYSNIRFEIEQSAEKDLNTQEDVDNRLSQLMPEDIARADEFIMPSVITWIYYDILASLNPESEDYWELAYKTMFSISIHQFLLARNPVGWLYKNCRNMALICVIILIVLFSITMAELIMYYIKLLKPKG